MVKLAIILLDSTHVPAAQVSNFKLSTEPRFVRTSTSVGKTLVMKMQSAQILEEVTRKSFESMKSFISGQDSKL